MSLRPDIAVSLQSIQSQLGDDLGGVLGESTYESSIPQFRQTIALEHIGGLFAGGAFELEAGSYRFGTAQGSILFDSGKPQEPRFGLTVDPEGVVILHPTPSGVRLDGAEVGEPTAVALGQIIGVGHDRFRLRPKERLSVSRRGSSGSESPPGMPTPSKGREVDQAIIDWALETRDRELRSFWVDSAGPVQLYYQIERGELFTKGPEERCFGKALIGTTDRAYSLPDEIENANRATRDELASLLTVLPGVPVAVDLANSSVAIIGPKTVSRAIATWMVLSLAVRTAPEHLSIAANVDADPVEWSWLSRLPHTNDSDTAKLALTVISERRPPSVPVTGGIALLEQSAEVPEGVGSVIRLSADSATYTDLAGGEDEIEIAPIGLAGAVAVERSLMITGHISEGTVG